MAPDLKCIDLAILDADAAASLVATTEAVKEGA
jgi:hypothetical protein